MLERLRVEPGTAAGIDGRDPGDRLGFADKDAGRVALDALAVRLDELHGRLWAEGDRAVLLVLQGMDASGKDGAIRTVLSGLNPQGCSVASFKAPTDAELAQDYLWRVHAATPPRGHIGAFNRSHYEDVVAARAIGVVSPEECARRYGHIVDFERLLTDEGTTVVKVFLHISKDEQRERLQARIDDPTKGWKFRVADLEVRARWDEYHVLYEEAITATSTDEAPWFVVPADRKWVRDAAVATLLVETLERLDPRIPAPDPAVLGLRVD
ncbi:MAG: PPK2 family polyphosphate kinase [Acidimicrobiia bacterium]